MRRGDYRCAPAGNQSPGGVLNELQRFYESECMAEKARWASEQMQVVRQKVIASMKHATILDFLPKRINMYHHKFDEF